MTATHRWIALAVVTIALGAGASAAPPSAPERVANDIARQLVDGRYDAIAARFTPEMRAKIGPDQLRQVTDPLRAERGPATDLRVQPADGKGIPVEITWSKGNASQLLVVLSDDGRIAGLRIHDRPQTTDYETKASLRPPFRGTWTAMNADRDAKNPHFVNPNQTYAVDWLIVGDSGKTFRTDGKLNSDYYAYGQEALAPAAGVVAVVIDGVPENPEPGNGDGDRYNVGGNQIVIDLGGGEFALFCHLIPRSMRVHVGDRVKSGQVVALVGNSGHSTEPHLHFQLMDGPRLTVAHSLPARFADALVDGKPTKRAWPVTGNRVSAIGER